MGLQDAFDRYADRDWQAVEDGTVRFAMVGLGWWTRDRAIPAVADSDLCETTVLVSGSTEKGDRVASDVPTAEATLTYDEFHDGAAADEYDAVYLCTPNALHLEYARTAANLGKAVLCEKPMEANVERAERLAAVCEEAGVTLMVAYRMQTDPAVRTMRHLVREGFVGRPVQVNGHMFQPLLEMIPDPDQWRLDPEYAGYGTSVMDLGIYPINTARFVLDADPVAAQARMRSEGEAFADVPDEWAAFTVEYDTGVYGSFAASQHGYESGRFEVLGTEGRVTLDSAFFNGADRTLTLDRAGVESAVTVPQVDQMREEFDYFADRVLAGERPHPDGRHGVVDVRTLAAVYEAGQSGERETV
ncbi:MAG: D-xylose 1-dehydrogenase Gfo6 [Salinigranum sp.]